ncbi:coniferyl aldehyde dehydrogenase [Ferrimonas marina]|uniref:Aldehyde dehydrogenase n=1 Tax=Ferrimonas marina TaxID=299255 RepID=A0A1M5VM49_9GAMM|nr:coniferyl aldehyde dehydrogenase [Ferrimonas marina]SHH76248.1 coniferyl-aldehyde dehydrogenase [Ferrimonas marina]
MSNAESQAESQVSTQDNVLSLDSHQDLSALLQRQRTAYQAAPYPTLDQRINHLDRLHQGLVKHQQALLDALSEDFGHRSGFDSQISDLLPCLNQIHYHKKHLKRWMKPVRRSPGLLLSPAKVTVHYQPLGVVGIVVPWNFPVFLAIGPLITALAAGNRAMIKLSEFTPNTNRVLTQLLSEQFESDQVVTIEGEADRAAAFSALPFDHLFFTGSTAVGRHVMRAAADNLTPVTLELGGKSPTFIGPDIDIKDAVQRLIWGKCLNAGQICVAPDYVLVPKEKIDEFAQAYQAAFNKLYPKGLASDDYSSVVNPAQYQRLQRVLQDAEEKGARTVPVAEPACDDEQHRMVSHLLLDVDDSMTVMQEEIFGPLLPLVPYNSVDEAIQYIQDRPRPLALYLMSHDSELQQRVIAETHAGGVALNETVMQVAADDAPFGGIGPSGMGHYHGHEGFLTLSKAKTVLQRGKFYPSAFIQPPYGGWIHRLLTKLFLR